MAGATTVGKLVIDMAADVATLKTDMANATRVVESSAQKMVTDLSAVRAGIESMMNPVKSLTAAFGPLAAAIGGLAIVDKIQSAISGMAELAEMAKRTGASVEALSALKGFAKATGTDMDDVAKGLAKMSKALVEAKADAGSAVKAFQALKLDPNQFKSSEEAMLGIAKKIADLKNGYEQVAAAQMFFGKNGATLVPVLLKLAEAGALNSKVTTAQAEQARQYEMAMAKLSGRFNQFYIALASEVLPILVKATEGFGTFISIGAAYFAAFTVAPAVFSAASTALAVLGGALDAVAMSAIAGTAATVSLNTPLFGTSVAAELAAGSLTKLKLASSVLFAAFAGWQIGSWLRDQFVEARLAGIALVEGLMVGWEHVKASFELQVAAMRAVWNGFIKLVSGGLQSIPGMKDFAAKLSSVATVDGASMSQVLANRQRRIEQIRAITGEMAAAEIAAAANKRGEKKGGSSSLDLSALGGGRDDAYKAFIEKMEGLYRQEEQSLQFHLQIMESQHKRALLGDIQFEDQRYQAIIDAIEREKAIREQEMSAAQAAGNAKDVAKRLAEIQELNNKEELEAAAHAERLYSIAQQAQQTITQIDAEEMKKRGQLVAAFDLEFQAKHTNDMQKAQTDLEYGMAISDNKIVDNAKKMIDALNRLYKSGLNESAFSETKNRFESAFASMTAKIEDAKQAAEADGGLVAKIDAAGIADAIRAEALPALQAMADKLKQIADASNNEALKKQAVDIARTLEKETKKIDPVWKDAVRSIDDTFQQGFEAMLDRGANAWKSFTEGLKNSFKKTVADAMYQMFARPFVMNIVASVGGALGFSGIAQAAGGGGSLGLLSSGASLFSNGGGILGGLLGGGGGAGEAFTGFASGAGAISEAGALGSAAGGVGEAFTALSAGGGAAGGLGGLIAAIPGWGWALGAAALLGSLFGDDGPEKHTTLSFGNKTGSTIRPTVNTAFGGYGVTGDFWSGDTFLNPAFRKNLDAYLASVMSTDAAFSKNLSAAEIATVTQSLQNKSRTFQAGEEHTDPAKFGTYDEALKSHITDVFKAIDSSLTDLIDGFKGGSAELANEAAGILDIRKKISEGSFDKIFGQKMTLADIVGIKAEAIDNQSKEMQQASSQWSAAARQIIDTYTALGGSLEEAQNIAEQQLGAAAHTVTQATSETAQLAERIGDLRKEGETTTQAFNRLAAEFQATNLVAELLGKTSEQAFGAVGLSSREARERLIEFSGGISALNAGLSSYYQNFYSEEERMTRERANVMESLQVLGISGVTSKEQFRSLVDGIDLTTTEGSKLFAELMQIAPAFAQVVDYFSRTATAADNLSQASAKMADGVNALASALNKAMQETIAQMDKLQNARTAIGGDIQTLREAAPGFNMVAARTEEVEELQKQLTSSTGVREKIDLAGKLQTAIMARYQAEMAELDKQTQAKNAAGRAAVDAINAAGRAAAESANSLNAIYRRIGDYAKSLLVGSESPLTQQAKVDVLKAQYGDLLVRAQAGDRDAAEKLQGVSSELLRGQLATARTSEEYARQFAVVQSDLATLGEKAGADQKWIDQQFVEDASAYQTAALALQNSAIEQLQSLEKQAAKWQTELQTALEQQAQAYANSGLTLAEIAANTKNVDTRIANAIAGALNASGAGANSGNTNAQMSEKLARAITDWNNYFANSHAGDVRRDAATFGAGFWTRLEGNMTRYTGADGHTTLISATESFVDIAKRDPELRAAWEKQYGITLPSFAVGTDYVPHDMIAHIHQGERIIPAAQNRGDKANEALVAEIRALLAEVAMQRKANDVTATNMQKFIDLWRRVTQDGNSLLTTPA